MQLSPVAQQEQLVQKHLDEIDRIINLKRNVVSSVNATIAKWDQETAYIVTANIARAARHPHPYGEIFRAYMRGQTALADYHQAHFFFKERIQAEVIHGEKHAIRGIMFAINQVWGDITRWPIDIVIPPPEVSLFDEEEK